MKIIGITGVIAAGKTAICSRLDSFIPDKKFYIFDCDKECHNILPDAKEREKIAKDIFLSDEKRITFEKAIWASLRPILEKRIKEISADFFIIDAPTLFQSGFDALCQYIVFVTAPRGVRRARFIARGGKGDADFEKRDGVQEKFFLSHKDIKIDCVLDTSRDDYFSKLQDFLNRL